MAQIAAETLAIPLEQVRVTATDTQAISDASPTAASTGSDLNGGAVQMACRQLRARLEKFCEDLEQYTVYFAKFDPTVMDQDQVLMIEAVTRNWRTRWSEVWPTICALAYINRIDLTAAARYATPHYSAVDLAHPFGQPFFYYTYAVAVSEVEVDVLTGEHTILRSDILFDLGRSLNPLLDVGQIEGGFVQGIGYVTVEELLLQGASEAPRPGIPAGAITSYGTWDYKPPGSKSIPLDFRVKIVDHPESEHRLKGPRLKAAAVKRSKGIGEPPLVLGNTVFFAIRQAITAYRRGQGDDEFFRFDAPATINRIQQACQVKTADLKI
jgi:xanthine dehydrogenase/oxidase